MSSIRTSTFSQQVYHSLLSPPLRLLSFAVSSPLPSPLLCRLLSSQSCLGMSSIRTLTFFQQVDQSPLFSSLLLSLAASCPHRPASVCHPFELQPFLNKFITDSSLLLSISSPLPPPLLRVLPQYVIHPNF